MNWEGGAPVFMLAPWGWGVPRGELSCDFATPPYGRSSLVSVRKNDLNFNHDDEETHCMNREPAPCEPEMA